MSANTFVTSGAYLTDNPAERLAGETALVEITVVDNAWNEKRYKPKFITCSFSGKMADTARALRRGDPVTVGGRLDFRTYEAKAGGTRVAFEIQRPTLLVPHVDLRSRAAAGGDSTDAGAEGAATPDDTGTGDSTLAPAAASGSRWD